MSATSAATAFEPLANALENQFGLADRVIDPAALANSVARFREQGIRLPTFAQLNACITLFDGSLGKFFCLFCQENIFIVVMRFGSMIKGFCAFGWC